MERSSVVFIKLVGCSRLVKICGRMHSLNAELCIWQENDWWKNSSLFSLFFLFFPQLRDTKSIGQNTTLLHFLAEKCERNHESILRFPDELEHVEAASRGMTTLSHNRHNRHLARVDQPCEGWRRLHQTAADALITIYMSSQVSF